MQNTIKIQCDNLKKTNNYYVRREERRGKGGEGKECEDKETCEKNEEEDGVWEKMKEKLEWKEMVYLHIIITHISVDGRD